MDKEFKDLTEKEYRSYDLESYSSLKYLLKSPKDFLYYKNNPFKGSNSTLLGTCIHHHLQGNGHLVAYSIIDRRKKEEYAKFEQEFRELAGEEGLIVPASFEKTIQEINKSANDNPVLQKYLLQLDTEVPLVSEYKGLKYKAKIDGLGSDYVLEIKSSSQATDSIKFKEECSERDYDLQAFMYLHATGKVNHFFVVANTTAPFKVAIYKTSKETIQNGRKKLDRIVEAYQKYIIEKQPFVEGETLDEV